MKQLAPCLPLLLLVACATPSTRVAAVVSSAPAPALPAVDPAPAHGRTWQEAPPSGEDHEALAKKLANPVASLISVPLQLNWDGDVGPSDGERLVLNVQPVVPFSLSADWNLISRTIVPLVDQNDIPAGEDEFGLGDVLQSLFFSPVEPTRGGWIWGVGPALLVPTATDETLGLEKLALGPTAVALRQSGPWTYGALMNHVWSVAGNGGRADVSSTFVQPFVAHTTPSAWTYSLNTESTYDWKREELAAPINASFSKVLKLAGQLVSVGAGARYWAESADGGPEGWGARVTFTLLFPK